jgi:antitoxin component of MazEF toxin-antitoxin module
VRRWGRSIAVAIPAHLAKQLNWTAADYVTVQVENGAVVLRKLDVRAALAAPAANPDVMAEAV